MVDPDAVDVNAYSNAGGFSLYEGEFAPVFVFLQIEFVEACQVAVGFLGNVFSGDFLGTDFLQNRFRAFPAGAQIGDLFFIGVEGGGFPVPIRL